MYALIKSRNSRRKNFISIALAGILMLSLPFTVYAAPSGGKTIGEQKSELNDAKSEKSSLKSKLANLQNLKKELLESKMGLSAYVEELDADLSDIQAELSELNILIEKKNEEIKETKQNLLLAKEDEEKQYFLMRERIRFMYESSANTYIQVILTSTSLTDLLNKASYIEKLTAYDRNMLKKFQDTRKYVEQLQKDLEEEQVALEAVKTKTEENEEAVQTLIADKQTELEAFENDIANKEQAIREYEDMLAQQDALISSLEKAVAAAEAAAARAVSGNGILYSGGRFCWPAPSYKSISSDYGTRMHPILHVERFHTGIDMAAPLGSAILAAAEGEVVAASYNDTMGNYVMISHGGGLYTIYMHASSLGVSTGMKVSKGQQIAAVGSTGRSTGPHLHFGVRLNGGYVNPWSYLKG